MFVLYIAYFSLYVIYAGIKCRDKIGQHKEDYLVSCKDCTCHQRTQNYVMSLLGMNFHVKESTRLTL